MRDYINGNYSFFNEFQPIEKIEKKDSPLRDRHFIGIKY